MTIAYRECEHCGFVFPARNSRSRFCTSAHRTAAWKKAQRETALIFSDAPTHAVPPPQSAPTADPFADGDLTQQEDPDTAPEAEEDDDASDETPSTPAPIAQDGELYSLTRQRLSTADRVETWEGRAALILGGRLDNHQGESGSGLKALWTAYREAMAMALSSAGAGHAAAPTAEAATEPAPEQDQPAPAGPIDMLAALRAREESRRDGTAS